LTEIRDHHEVGDYLAEVFRMASKKSVSYSQHGHFFTRPIMLVCHSDELPFYDVQQELEALAYWDDFDHLGFTEVWLMDLADAYYSAQDPRLACRPVRLDSGAVARLSPLRQLRPKAIWIRGRWAYRPDSQSSIRNGLWS
jgi:hypothetical protein